MFYFLYVVLCGCCGVGFLDFLHVLLSFVCEENTACFFLICGVMWMLWRRSPGFLHVLLSFVCEEHAACFYVVLCGCCGDGFLDFLHVLLSFVCEENTACFFSYMWCYVDVMETVSWLFGMFCCHLYVRSIRLVLFFYMWCYVDVVETVSWLFGMFCCHLYGIVTLRFVMYFFYLLDMACWRLQGVMFLLSDLVFTLRFLKAVAAVETSGRLYVLTLWLPRELHAPSS